ncbi:MAG: 6-pyruvoyl-tetrahydropterin synthase-related protein [Patescibacteria group bacterium]
MKRVLPYILLALAGFFAVRPLVSPGFFPMHDDTQVARVIEMGRALRDFQFPVRWVNELGYGYGYPIFNFYGPLPYYFGGLLYAVGVPAVLATKIMFAAGILLPALLVTLLIELPYGLLAGVLFLFAPYHAVQIYVRGAVGEYWSLVFFPLIAYWITGWGKPATKKSAAAGAIGIGGVILSHTLMGFAVTIFVGCSFVLYRMVRYLRNRDRLRETLSASVPLLLGMGLAGFFWLPAMFEMQFTGVSGQVSASADYKDHFVCITQLYASLWGFGGSAKGCVDGMSFMVGKAHLLLGFAGLVTALVLRPKRMAGLIGVAVAAAFVGVLFATEASKWLWDSIPGFAYLQYPWRFLGILMFGTSLLGSFAMLPVKNAVAKWAATIAICVGVILLNGKWFMPQYTYEKPSTAFEAPSDVRWRVSKISDEYLPRSVPRPDTPKEADFATIEEGNGLSARLLTKTTTREVWSVIAAEEMPVRINKAPFPGWRYFIDDKEVRPTVKNGLPELTLAAGQSYITMRFTDTPIRVIGNGISLVSLIIFIYYLYAKQHKTKR